MQAGPASSEQAGLAQLCRDSQGQAHTQTPIPLGCLCDLYLPLSVGPPRADGAQTPFLISTSYVLSLSNVCLRTACVGLRHAESMHWVCLPCTLPHASASLASVFAGHSGRRAEGWCSLAPRPFPLGCRKAAVLASVLCHGCLIHASHLLTASQALLRHQPPFILFSLRKITAMVMGTRGLSLAKQGVAHDIGEKV